MTSSTIDQRKQAMRQAAYDRRNALPADERARLSQAVRENFMAHVTLPPKGSVIGGYVPVYGELDIKPLLLDLAGMGYVVTVPYVIDRESRCIFLEWNEQTPLIRNLMGIPEPDPKKTPEHVPDFCIVPMLAFDVTGARLGYGSGMFDRTFAFIRKFHPLRTVGVAYEFLKQDEVPVGQHDVPLDCIVTESAFYRVNQEAP